MGKKSRLKMTSSETRITLTQEEALDFLRTVRDDLALLRRLNFARPLRSEVRVASSILRRLLHEMMLPNAWQLCGLEGEPSFTAVDLDSTLKSVDRKYIHYAYAGGAKTAGAQHDGYTMLVIPKAELEAEGQQAVTMRISASMRQPERRLFSFSEFCTSTSVASGHAGISRLGLVRYVANKLGGVHWDNCRGNWTDPVGSRHRLLDEAHIIVGRLPAPLYEVLSIAEAIAESEDITRLLEKIEAVAPEDEGGTDVIRFREGRIGKYADMTFNTPQDGLASGPEGSKVK